VTAIHIETELRPVAGQHDPELRTTTFGIGGMHCAACASRNERALKNLVRAAIEYNQSKSRKKAPAGVKPKERNIGGHFKGYELDKQDRPIFHYVLGGIDVYEQPLAAIKKAGPVLVPDGLVQNPLLVQVFGVGELRVAV
jgi:copper chaperone CopZ